MPNLNKKTLNPLCSNDYLGNLIKDKQIFLARKYHMKKIYIELIFIKFQKDV